MKKTTSFFLSVTLVLLTQIAGYAQKHPIAFSTAADIALVKKNISVDRNIKSIKGYFSTISSLYYEGKPQFLFLMLKQ